MRATIIVATAVALVFGGWVSMSDAGSGSVRAVLCPGEYSGDEIVLLPDGGFCGLAQFRMTGGGELQIGVRLFHAPANYTYRVFASGFEGAGDVEVLATANSKGRLKADLRIVLPADLVPPFQAQVNLVQHPKPASGWHIYTTGLVTIPVK